jgi:translation initiation factor 5B
MVTSIESNHKTVPSARKGMEVCIKIEPIPGETPKMFGRHFDETDMLISKVSRRFPRRPSSAKSRPAELP